MLQLFHVASVADLYHGLVIARVNLIRACCLTQSSNAVLYLTVACVILECAAPAAHDSSPSLTSIDFAKSLGFTLHRLSLYMIMCGLADGTAHGGFVPCLMVVCFICDHGLR